MTAPSSPRDNGGQRTSTAAALVLLWLAVIVLPLPVREVMPPDESRFAHQAEVMHTSGDWIVPRIGDVPNADKPPGLFWSVNLVSLVTGHVTETTARVPSALAALMVMFLTVRLGRRLWGDATLGLGAAAMLVTGVEFSQKGQWCSCDMLLTAFSLGASTLWREAVFERERGGHLMIAAGWLCAAIATLTKGPLGLLWPLWWVIAEAAARRRWKPTLALLVPSGPVLYLLLVFGWLTAFKAGAGETLAHEALFTQTVTRYLNSWNSFQPPYFFLIQTPGDFFPWSLFFPAAAVAWWRLRRDADATTGVDRVAWRASLVFLGIALVFFSLSPGKRGVYLLPAFPMLALCTARGFLSIGGRWRRVPLRLLACVGIVVGLVIPLVVAVIRPRVALDWGERVGFGWVAALVACGASLSIGALFALRRHDSAPRALASVVAGMAVCLSILGTLGGAAWSRYQDGSGFGTVVATIVPARSDW
ncbi:MAG: phospholipid carrier-dependent glycosyltransferase [Acidobacteriota bacterium]